MSMAPLTRRPLPPRGRLRLTPARSRSCAAPRLALSTRVSSTRRPSMAQCSPRAPCRITPAGQRRRSRAPCLPRAGVRLGGLASPSRERGPLLGLDASTQYRHEVVTRSPDGKGGRGPPRRSRATNGEFLGEAVRGGLGTRSAGAAVPQLSAPPTASRARRAPRRLLPGRARRAPPGWGGLLPARTPLGGVTDMSRRAARGWIDLARSTLGHGRSGLCARHKVPGLWYLGGTSALLRIPSPGRENPS